MQPQQPQDPPFLPLHTTTPQQNPTLHLSSRLISHPIPSLQLQLTHKPTSTHTNIYQAELPELKKNQLISQTFDNLAEVQDYIRNIENLDINLEKKIVIILVKQKNKNIKLAELGLVLVESKEEEQKKEKKEEGLGVSDEECIGMIIGQLEAREDTRKTVRLLTDIVGKLVGQRKEHNQFRIKMQNQVKELKNKNKELQSKLQKLTAIRQQNNVGDEGKVDVLNMGSSSSLEDSRKEGSVRQEELEQLREQIYTLNEQVIKMKKGRSKIFQKIQQPMIQSPNPITTTTTAINPKQQHLKNQSKQDLMMQMIQRLQQKMQIFAQETQKRFDQQSQSLEYFQKIADEMKKSAPSPISAITWIDPSCAFYRKAKIQKNSITAWDQAWLIGTKQIKQKYSFSFTINRMKQNFVFGIIDARQKPKTQWTTSKVLAYYSYGKFRLCDTATNKAGDKIFRGECTTVIIDPKNGLFQVRAGNTLKFKTDASALFMDKSIVFVPFIGLNDKNDKVSLSE